ncbi:hypothetical protein DFH28DRAFT_1090573 [Melampsora americana]|nr:hypothetical protein DFH28DRAFT_1090573 [Melampsora americana]
MDYSHSETGNADFRNTLIYSQNGHLPVPQSHRTNVTLNTRNNNINTNQFEVDQGAFFAPDYPSNTNTPIHDSHNHTMNLIRNNTICTNPNQSSSINQIDSFNSNLHHHIGPTQQSLTCFDNLSTINQHNHIDTSHDQDNPTLNPNSNQHMLLGPKPQRAPIPININALETNPVSSETGRSISCFQQRSLAQQVRPSNLPMPSIQPVQSNQSSQKTNKPSSRAKKSTQSKSNKETPTEKQPTHVGGSTVTKSSKAAVDEFLAPSSRLPADISLPENYTVDELFNKFDAVELRTMADKHSRGDGTKKGVLSNAKKQILRDFHQSTEKLLAILCIHLGISQDVAATEVGKWTYIRASRAYDLFKGSQQVRDIYRKNGGATNEKARQLVKELWASLSQDEKDAFLHKDSDDDTSDNLDEGLEGHDDYGVNPEEIPDNRPIQKGLVKIVRGSNDEVIRQVGLQTSGRDLGRSRSKCEDFVSDFIKKANHMSRIHPVQFTITAVSTHLSSTHCFQFMATTPGLWDWADYDLGSSAKHESTTSKMQAYVTGKTIAGLVRPKRSRGSTVEKDKLKETLNQIIRKSTNKPQENWPWSNCEDRLQDAGFELRYEPSDSLYRSWITRPNSGLTDEMARRVNMDITSNPISLIPIEGFIDKYKVKNKKRKSSETEALRTGEENGDESDLMGI